MIYNFCAWESHSHSRTGTCMCYKQCTVTCKSYMYIQCTFSAIWCSRWSGTVPPPKKVVVCKEHTVLQPTPVEGTVPVQPMTSAGLLKPSWVPLNVGTDWYITYLATLAQVPLQWREQLTECLGDKHDKLNIRPHCILVHYYLDFSTAYSALQCELD